MEYKNNNILKSNFEMFTPTKLNMKPLIYSYFELVDNEEPHIGNKNFSTWQCKSDWCKKKVVIPGSTNSNLKTHLLSAKHKPEKEEFDKKTAETTPKQASKRLRVDEHNEVSSPLLQMGISKSLTPAKIKFNRNHPRQIEWYEINILYIYSI